MLVQIKIFKNVQHIVGHVRLLAIKKNGDTAKFEMSCDHRIMQLNINAMLGHHDIINFPPPPPPSPPPPPWNDDDRKGITEMLNQLQTTLKIKVIQSEI